MVLVEIQRKQLSIQVVRPAGGLMYTHLARLMFTTARPGRGMIGFVAADIFPCLLHRSGRRQSTDTDR